MKKKVFICIGSNKGNKVNNIKKAIMLLRKNKIDIHKISNFYETEPVGYKKQENFINCVVKVYTSISPLKLLRKLKNIENKMGRERCIKWGPRIIDLDIIFYDNLIVENKYIKIPHPSFHRRNFVLFPFADVYD